MKKRAVVICPGRGSYTKETLGYLRQFGNHVRPYLNDLDNWRASLGEPTISDLDSDSTFKPQVHTKGEHASPLIYACAYADFMAINREQYEIVAIAGNSMGWYLTLAFGGALDKRGGFEVVNTMGSMMKDGLLGGQIIYPVVDENWRPSKERVDVVNEAVNRAMQKSGQEIYLSISLGGYVVLGAEQEALNVLLKELPAFENYPFQLINHGAFHTPILRPVAERAFHTIPESLFQKPHTPLIDGRGYVWTPYSTSTEDLYHYTLGHQVVEPYDFTQSIVVALKEFAPDTLILLGPGSSLGGSIGQILIAQNWQGLDSKQAFTSRQAENPFLVAMGRADQRKFVT